MPAISFGAARIIRDAGEREMLESEVLHSAILAFRSGSEKHNQHADAQNQRHGQRSNSYGNPNRLLIAVSGWRLKRGFEVGDGF